jgi:hypothetical protein
MNRLQYRALILCLLFASPALGQTVGAQPDLAGMARAGRASIKRFQNESASWTSTTVIPNGLEFIVEVISTPAARRLVLSAAIQGRRHELARIIQKDGVWYTVQGPAAAKYRPFEAPLDVPTAYLYLTRSDPQFVTETEPDGFGTCVGTKDGIATFRNPLPEPQRKQLENSIADLQKYSRENAKVSGNPETKQTIDRIRQLLLDGLSTDVSLESGMITQFGATERRTRITKFNWNKSSDQNNFNTNAQIWDDHCDDPTAGDRDDLVMIAHSGIWRPGMKSHETDARLLHLKTGRYRRIPFQGVSTLPGCFTPDRTRVVVTGLDPRSGVMGLYEINLRTGENRQLGGKPLAAGFSLFPSLSPDGKTVAVLHKGSSERLTDTQITLVDLATGNAKPVGTPRDTGPVSWFPDGKALLTFERNDPKASKPAAETVCRIGLDGRVERIVEGALPVIVDEGKRILFQDVAFRTWKTCDMNGADVKVYANGLQGYGFPAPSPDGKRLLMIRFRPGQAPEPMILPLGQSEGKPATTAPGLWTTPAWR